MDNGLIIENIEKGHGSEANEYNKITKKPENVFQASNTRNRKS